MSRREKLLQAIEQEDTTTLAQLGWRPILDLLGAWKPKQRLTWTDLRVYTHALGDHEPTTILAAIHATAGRWRPTPGEVLGHLNQDEREERPDGNPNGPHPLATPTTLAAVGAAYH